MNGRMRRLRRRVAPGLVGLFVLHALGAAPLPAQAAADPDLDPDHFETVLTAADSALLREWAVFGALDGIRCRLSVEPRPYTRGERGPDWSSLEEGAVAEVRRGVLQRMGLRISNPEVLACVQIGEGESLSAYLDRVQPCRALNLLWVYVSLSTPVETPHGDPPDRWRTYVFGTRIGPQEVLAEVETRREGGQWVVEGVRQVWGVMAHAPTPEGSPGRRRVLR